MTITYDTPDTKVFVIRVLLDGSCVGMIREDGNGKFYYAPKFTKSTGERFATVAEVKRSIEAE